MAVNRGEYSTVSDIRSVYLDIKGAADDPLLLDLLRGVCREIDRAAHQFFYPLVETRYFDTTRDVTGAFLRLDRPLLAVTTLTNGDATTISASSYVFEPRNTNDTPKWGIRLLGSAGLSWTFQTDPENAISIDGIWGYHADYNNNAWIQADTLGASMSDTTGTSTTLTTADSVKAGQLIKVDSEIMYAGAVDGTAVTGIVRGANGSTAATHSSSAALYVWTLGDALVQLARTAAIMRYRERAHPNSETFTLATGETIIVPKDIGKWIEKEVDRLGLVRLQVG